MAGLRLLSTRRHGSPRVRGEPTSSAPLPWTLDGPQPRPPPTLLVTPRLQLRMPARPLDATSRDYMDLYYQPKAWRIWAAAWHRTASAVEARADDVDQIRP